MEKRKKSGVILFNDDLLWLCFSLKVTQALFSANTVLASVTLSTNTRMVSAALFAAHTKLPNVRLKLR